MQRVPRGTHARRSRRRTLDGPEDRFADVEETKKDELGLK